MHGCCKEVYRFPRNITYTYSTCISSFLQQHPYSFVRFLNVFMFLFMIFFCNIANVDLRTLKNRDHTDMAI